MPTYLAGTAPALYPGDLPLTLVNAETVAAGYKSMAFVRGPSPAETDNGVTVQILFAANATATVALEGSNVDVDADYVIVASAAFAGAGAAGSITDSQRYVFYRLHVTAYTSGGILTALAAR